MTGGQVNWAFVRPPGIMTKGTGTIPGLAKIAKLSTAGAFRLRGLPPLFVAGAPSLIWAVDAIVGVGPVARFWGFEVPEGHRLWTHPRGDWLGIGREVEDVEDAIKAFGGRP